MIPWIALSGLVGGSAMAYWASTNLFQTYKISGDNAKYRDLQWAEYDQQSRYLDMRGDELAWNQERYWLDQVSDAEERAWEIEQSERYQAQQLERMYQEQEYQNLRDDVYWEREQLSNQQDYRNTLSRDDIQFSRQLELEALDYQNQLSLNSQYDNFYKQNQTLAFERDLYRDDLQHQRNIVQTQLIHASDVMQGDQRNLLQLELQRQELEQEDRERNAYLQEKIFAESHSILSQFGNETNVGKLTYIIGRLKALLPREYIHTPVKTTDTFSGSYDTPVDFDYAAWHVVPGEE